MSLLTLILLPPVLAALAILVLRRALGALVLAGAGLSLAGAGVAAMTAWGSAAVTASLPFLPNLPVLLLASPLTATLSLLVATVAAMVLIYGLGYMAKDPERPRFFATMLFFVAAMQLLVLAGDWITLLAAWEMIGFASYLLIGFWHARAGVAEAATRACQNPISR